MMKRMNVESTSEAVTSKVGEMVEVRWKIRNCEPEVVYS